MSKRPVLPFSSLWVSFFLFMNLHCLSILAVHQCLSLILLPTFSGIPIINVWPYISQRLLGPKCIFFNLPSDNIPYRGSQHFLGYYLQIRAPRDQLIPVHIQTLDQWGCVWRHPATRDVSSKSVLDQFLGGGLGPPYLSNAQTPPRNYLVDSSHRANRLCWVFFSVLHSASNVRRDEFEP